MTTVTVSNYADKLITARSRLETKDKAYNENKWHKKFWSDLIDAINNNDEALISLIGNSNILEIILLPFDKTYNDDVVELRKTFLSILLNNKITYPLKDNKKSLALLPTMCLSLDINKNNQQNIIDIAFKYFISFDIDDENNDYNKFEAPSVITYIYNHFIDKIYDSVFYFGDYGVKEVDEWKRKDLLFDNDYIIKLIQRGFEIFSVYNLQRLENNHHLIRKTPWYYSSDDHCYYDPDQIKQCVKINDFKDFMKNAGSWGYRLCFFLFVVKIYYIPLSIKQLKSKLYDCSVLNNDIIDNILQYDIDEMNIINQYDDEFIYHALHQFFINIHVIDERKVDQYKRFDLRFFVDNILIPIKQNDIKFYKQIQNVFNEKFAKIHFFSITFVDNNDDWKGRNDEWDKQIWFNWLDFSESHRNPNQEPLRNSQIYKFITKFIEFGDIDYLDLLLKVISNGTSFTRFKPPGGAMIKYKAYWDYINKKWLADILLNQDIDQKYKDIILKYKP